MRTTAFPVKQRLRNLLSCKIPLCFYSLSVQHRHWLCISQCLRYLVRMAGRLMTHSFFSHINAFFTLTQKRTRVPLVPMTPRKTSSLQSYQTGALDSHQALYLEQRRGSILPTEQRLCSTAFILSLISSDLG